ncbi:2-hydroxy-palmitic acid dioxygenase MPO1-like [Humulus lupulus]|uniref:2-hydroxy-palmitic acid dioxygenase MPO1-like n=1 Tax=Humulus lupulus TaxID=3486 RepID=UPI002B413D60|nr:2-hydroxy-palmitic acid dioxygenase MPO1-like [Humulus lupulus]
MGRSGLFDLEKHFAFYGAYHSNPVNILIHTLFVWPIVFSTLLLMYFTPSLFNFPYGFDPGYGLILNLGFVFTVIYSLFYVCLDNKAGSLAALLCFLCWVGASLLGQRLGFSLGWKVGLAAQLVCWTGQFIGHGVFEKRAPALLDNLVQAFLMAPFFVLLEVLLSVLDYEPYPGFRTTVEARINADIQEWQEKKQKKIF